MDTTNELQQTLDQILATEPDEPKSKSKSKSNTKPKIKRSPLIRTSKPNESKYYNGIRAVCDKINKKFGDKPVTIVDAYGNTGLISYWFKTFCPNANVIFNDTYNLIDKIRPEIRDEFLNGITIEHKKPDQWNDDESVVLFFNPRVHSYNISWLINKRTNYIFTGSTSDTNHDPLAIYYAYISDGSSPIGSTIYVSETDYVHCIL